MLIFYDTEFVERGPDIPIMPVSFGFVAEDGRELYLINEGCLSTVLRHPWLSLNVAPSLPIRADIGGPNFIAEWDREHPEYPHVVSLEVIRQAVQHFISKTPNPQLWADYGAYDHVVYAQLFGTMTDLPAGFPMFTHELRQVIELHPDARLPPQPEISHHALWDAHWAKAAYEALHPLRDAPSEVLTTAVGLLDGNTDSVIYDGPMFIEDLSRPSQVQQ